MPQIVRLIAMLAVAALAAACAAPGVPDQPTWTEDVRPIVVGNCIRCHTPPQQQLAPPTVAAPTNVRFDKYDGEDRNNLPSVFGDDPLTPENEAQPDVGDDGVNDDCRLPDVCGAGTPLHDGGLEAIAMADRVALDVSNASHMPPMFDLWQREKDVMRAWADGGAPRGPALPGNRPPTLTLGDFQGQGDILVAEYQIDDPDLDLVTGKLIAEPDDGGDPVVVTWELFTGKGQVLWDLAPTNQDPVASGTYQLSAEIDDESEKVTVPDLGSVTVP